MHLPPFAVIASGHYDECSSKCLKLNLLLLLLLLRLHLRLGSAQGGPMSLGTLESCCSSRSGVLHWRHAHLVSRKQRLR